MTTRTALIIATLFASTQFLPAEFATLQPMQETQKTLTPDSVLADLAKEGKIRSLLAADRQGDDPSLTNPDTCLLPCRQPEY